MRTIGVGTPPWKTIGMYSACLFCHADLGQNEAIEAFPLGRRLAFDAARGRLWVVCAECKGWNLTPLEERWEAVEECERRYQDTRVRVSTGQISLARLRDGLDLIRIGEPARPEFAAWRYGERLALRRRNSLIRAGLGLGVLGAVVAGGAVVGVSAGIAAMWISAAASAMTRGSPHKILAFINWRTRSRLVVRRKHLAEARLLPTGEGYRISVPGHTMELSDEWAADLSGHAAIGAASRLLPEVNRFGGSRRSIAAATSLLARWPEPSALYAMIAAHGEANGGTPFADLPVEQRLALEMAAHEDTERRALEGELDELMSAWRDAEEIARISDAMFQPVEIGDWLARAKAQGT